MSRSLPWSLGATALIALSMVLASLAESSFTAPLAGSITLFVVGGLWWLWKREQAVQASPLSEYLAIGYIWAVWANLVFAWDVFGERWTEWFVMLPPISFLPPVSRALVRRFSGRSGPAIRVSRLLHRLVAVVFLGSVAFFVLTVLGIVVAPIPLVAAVFHVVAGRFYARQASP